MVEAQKPNPKAYFFYVANKKMSDFFFCNSELFGAGYCHS